MEAAHSGGPGAERLRARSGGTARTLRLRLGRARRYSQITRIAIRHGTAAVAAAVVSGATRPRTGRVRRHPRRPREVLHPAGARDRVAGRRGSASGSRPG